MNHYINELHHIWKARKRIRSLFSPTPLIQSEELSQTAGVPVYLKMETHLPTHTFKVRGAANKILSLDRDQQKRGVTTFSTGNHGMAVAYVARLLGIPAVICVSQHVPPVKTEGIRRLGAHLHIDGENQDEARAACNRIEKEEGLTVIPPFDDPWIIAGQGTIGLELMESLPELGSVAIPLSGGGLLSGIGLAIKANHPSCQIIGVSMEGPAVMHYSLQEGKPLETIQEQPTLADSLLGGIGTPNRYTFPMVQRFADQTILVGESEIAGGITVMLKHHRTVVEGAAATTIAALLHQKMPANDGQPIVLVISGGNIDPSTLFQAVEKTSLSP